MVVWFPKAWPPLPPTRPPPPPPPPPRLSAHPCLHAGSGSELQQLLDTWQPWDADLPEQLLILPAAAAALQDQGGSSSTIQHLAELGYAVITSPGTARLGQQGTAGLPANVSSYEQRRLQGWEAAPGSAPAITAVRALRQTTAYERQLWLACHRSSLRTARAAPPFKAAPDAGSQAPCQAWHSAITGRWLYAFWLLQQMQCWGRTFLHSSAMLPQVHHRPIQQAGLQEETQCRLAAPCLAFTEPPSEHGVLYKPVANQRRMSEAAAILQAAEGLRDAAARQLLGSYQDVWRQVSISCSSSSVCVCVWGGGCATDPESATKSLCAGVVAGRCPARGPAALPGRPLHGSGRPHAAHAPAPVGC